MEQALQNWLCAPRSAESMHEPLRRGETPGVVLQIDLYVSCHEATHGTSVSTGSMWSTVDRPPCGVFRRIPCRILHCRVKERGFYR